MTKNKTKSIELYWRPGCGFCMGLDRGLAKHEGLPIKRHNIWDDSKAAAFVRQHSNGNEIVPTVRVGETVLVNPTTNQVLAAVAQEMPEALPEGWEPQRSLRSRLPFVRR